MKEDGPNNLESFSIKIIIIINTLKAFISATGDDFIK